MHWARTSHAPQGMETDEGKAQPGVLSRRQQRLDRANSIANPKTNGRSPVIGTA
jgi:hypothetical protein